MNISTTIEFNSLPVFYRKEVDGTKPNTVRIVTNKEDKIISGMLENIEYIRIVNTNRVMGTESFVRKLIDITRFESFGLIIYIFSW